MGKSYGLTKNQIEIIEAKNNYKLKDKYLKQWWDQNMRVWFNLNFEREYKDFKIDLDKIFNKDFIKFLEQASKKPVRD